MKAEGLLRKSSQATLSRPRSSYVFCRLSELLQSASLSLLRLQASRGEVDIEVGWLGAFYLKDPCGLLNCLGDSLKGYEEAKNRWD